MVEITDTDGDCIIFVLSENKDKITEYCNGHEEIESVTWLRVDTHTGMCHDAKGRFTIQQHERAPKVAALRSLFARIGVELTHVSAPRDATVEVDVDLLAPPEDLERQKTKAQEAVRKACETIGMPPEAALGSLSHVFSMASSASNSRVATAATASISRAAECLATVVGTAAEAAAAGRDELAQLREHVLQARDQATAGDGADVPTCADETVATPVSEFSRQNSGEQAGWQQAADDSDGMLLRWCVCVSVCVLNWEMQIS
jgi:hypothetical protein